MSIVRIIFGCIMGVLALASAIYVSFTARKKGRIFSNSFLWLSKEEQKNVDRNAEYKLVTIVFSCLALAFALLSLYIFTQWSMAYIAMWVVLAIVIIYAIVETVKGNKK